MPLRRQNAALRSSGLGIGNDAMKQVYVVGSAQSHTLPSAGEIDMRADPSLKAPLTADEHRHCALAALAQARALTGR